MHDLIIIGAGPAGLTAALYAGRYRLNTLLLEKMMPGGQIVLSHTIENFPGFPGGISTHELIDNFKKQVEELGVKIESDEVVNIAHNSKAKTYIIKTGSNTYEAKTVIVASGAQPRKLGVEGEEKLIGRGVSYCGTCDGPFFRDKEIVVVGGGDRAIEDAIFLTRYAKRVNLVHRRNQLRASKILEEKAKKEPKINFILESVIEKIEGEAKVEAVRIKNVKTNTQSELPCQGIFIFVGIKPNTDFLQNMLHKDSEGFIIVTQEMQTSLDGVFACGDCCKKNLYQVVNACGEAAVAAHSAHLYLLNTK